MENKNANQPKHIFQITTEAFFQAWKRTFDRSLVPAFQDYLNADEDFEEFGGFEKVDYDKFCRTLFATAPKHFEHRDN